LPELGRLFVEETIGSFREEYLPRLEAAVAAVPAEKLWWRPHSDATSIGNLLLHLEGNVRQWFLAGLGGEQQPRRERSAEFRARDAAGGSGEKLCKILKEAVESSYPVLTGLTDSQLTEVREIQGFRVTGLAAVYHVVEHFGWHLGQIVWIAKATAGPDHGIVFYDDDALDRH